MLPITRVNLQYFCRVCLCEHPTTTEPIHSISGVSSNQVFPYSICNSCHLKVFALKEFQRKTIFSTGILRLIIDENKSRNTTKASLKRLLKYCRVCLRRQSSERYNIRGCQELCKGMSDCTGLQLIGSYKFDAVQTNDVLDDDLRFPGALCNRCYATLKSYMEFQTVSKQTADYLENVLHETENVNIVKTAEESIQNERLDLEALQLTELLPIPESCILQSADSNSENETAELIDDPHSIQTLYLQSKNTEVGNNLTSSELSETETVSDKFDSKLQRQSFSDGDIKPLSTVRNIITNQRVPQKLGPKLRCHKCNQYFRKQFLYEAHVKSVHEGIKNAFACIHCTQSYPNMKALQRHISSNHKQNNQSASYFCKYCERAFKRNVRLQEHISTVHLKLKPFSCSICSKKFGTKNTLIRHEKNHSNEKPFSCEYCGKRYNSKSDLNVHIQRHTANPELLCPICKRAQPHKEELKRHIERHSKVYQCTTCGKIFQKMVNLREHVDTVHLKQKFHCQFCNLAFSARKSLKNHELGHNSTNWPEICVECKLYFKSKHSLLIHMKKSHLNTKTEHREGCTLCFRRFETKDSLKQHMEKLHPFELKNIVKET